MTRPDTFRLFAFYHLGFDDEFRYRFRNLHAAARHFGATPDQVLAWLAQDRLDPDTLSRTEFNLAQAHGEAQDLEYRGAGRADKEAFARLAFARYLEALERPLADEPKSDIDYDNPLGIPHKPTDDIDVQ